MRPSVVSICWLHRLGYPFLQPPMNVKLVPTCLGLSLLFIIPQVSFATSGACSYHGGVNCSSGPGPSGKVVCNDGWEDSSVWYGDASACNAGKSDLEVLSGICRYYSGWTGYYKGRLDKYMAEISILSPTYTPIKSTNNTTNSLSKCTGNQGDNAYDDFLSCLTHESDRMKDETARVQSEYQIARENQDYYLNVTLPALLKQADRKAFDETLNVYVAKANQIFKGASSQSINQTPVQKKETPLKVKEKTVGSSFDDEKVVFDELSTKEVQSAQKSQIEEPVEIPWYKKVLKFFSGIFDSIISLLQ